MTALIEAQRVTKVFGGGLLSKSVTVALEDFSFSVAGLRPEETLGRYPHQLSGGQRQRIMIARALLIKPSIIVADEPVSMVDASLRATILDSLRTLNRSFGISIVYITHDLATAYQISDTIVVLYRGSVAEAGDVELVVKQSQHPYTQLLVSSIPLASPERTWMTTHATVPAGPQGATDTGCKFAVRCLFVEPPCRETAPPLFQTDRRRAVSCYLYRGAPTLAADAMGNALTAPTAAAQPGRTVVTRTP